MTVLAVGWAVGGAGAATLRMNFVGGVTEATLAASETVDVEIWADLIGGETLAGVQFSNGPATGLTQAAVVAVPANWSQAANNGPLGSGVTEVSLSANSEGVLAGASSQLLARQTIQATADLAGSPVEVTFVVDGLHPALTNESGGDYRLAAAGSADAGRAGYFSIGSGSPAYTVGEEASSAQPLIVHPASAGGGGGGGTGSGNTNDNAPADGNVNVNDNAAGNTNDNTPTDGNANDNTAANDNSGGGTGGVVDTDNDGLPDDIDPDDDNDGILDDQDNTPQGGAANDNAGNDNTGGGDAGGGNGGSSGGGGSRGGLCGLGMLGAMPIGLAGMGAMAWRRRRGEDSGLGTRDWGLGNEARGGRCTTGPL
jgi:hypothetical protein